MKIFTQGDMNIKIAQNTSLRTQIIMLIIFDHQAVIPHAMYTWIRNARVIKIVVMIKVALLAKTTLRSIRQGLVTMLITSMKLMTQSHRLCTPKVWTPYVKPRRFI
jgi:hypothetical protein